MNRGIGTGRGNIKVNMKKCEFESDLPESFPDEKNGMMFTNLF
jgi:hypothetical protein